MSKTAINELELNGVKYVRKDSVSLNQQAPTVDGMEYCIVRTYSAGVFAGYVAGRSGQEVVLKQARRLWQWSGAASLSQLAVDGTKNPGSCKFPCEVPSIELLQAIEIIPMSAKAQKSISEVSVWKK